MDSDTVDASSLCSVSQPLDVLRLELQNEPAFAESNIPNDDHTLTFVPSPFYDPLHLLNKPPRPALSMWHTGAS